MVRALWKDEAGFVISSELILVATILVIGMIVGLVAVRDAVVQELGDVSAAIAAIDQTYTYDGVSNTCSDTTTAGSQFTDALDECDLSSSPAAGGVGSIAITLNPDPGQ